jgi:Carboxypeptidase regulatory-like domain
MNPFFRTLFLTLAFVLISNAQVERATITGTVSDSSGAVVPEATVRVIDEATNTTLTLKTDAAGEYTASNLTPGSYTIEAEKTGFTTHVNRGFIVQVSQIARLDITLPVGAVSQTVEVTGAVPVLQTENAAVGQVIGAQAVSQLPLNGRNLAQLAILAPGVTGLSYAPTGTINSGARPDELRPGGTTIEANGARDSANKLLLDGVDNTEMISQTFVVRPSIEGVQEFNLITSNAGAEYNRGGGAILVTSTKSGTNQFHGSLYDFVRNSYFDAKNFFDRPNAPIPPYKLNDFGASLGGPILHNRTFFFVNYEGYYERQASTVVTTVPTLAERQGNYQGIANVYDPLTTLQVGNTYVRTPFSNNIIPANRFDPIAAQIVNLYPLPQTASLVNNYVSNPLKSTDNDRGDVRIDHQITSTQMLFGRYSIDDARIIMPNTYNDAVGGNEGQFSGPDTARGQNGVLSYVNSISPSVVAEYRFGFNKFSSFLLPSPLTSPVWQEIPGHVNSDPYQPIAPIISPSGYGGLGNSRSEPLIRREHLFENIADVSWQHGRHNFKFGIDFLRHLISETDSPPGQSPFGRFNFDNTFTDNPASPGGTGNAIATMLLGYPASTVRDFFIPGTAHVIGNEFNYYARDDWRVTNKLTLNLGVHYEVDTPYHEANNYWVNFDPVTAQVLIAGKNASQTANWQTDYGSIGPRIGFAYQVDSRTVLRGGYGIFFDPEANEGTTIRQQRQWPFDLIYTITPGSLFPQNTVSQGFITLASLPPGTFNTPFGTLKGIQTNFKNASAQQFNFGLQRQVSDSSSITLTYLGSLGRHLTWGDPIDQPAPGPGNIQARRPYNTQFPAVTAITYLESAGNSAYQSFQASFQQRFKRGLYFTANWVWAHAEDNAPFDGGADGPIPQDPTNRRADWAASDNDIRHRINLYGTYELPFGPGKSFLNGTSLVDRYLAGGWQLNGIGVIQTGLPFTVTTTGSPTNTGASGRANLVSGVPVYPVAQSINEWFNPAAFAIPSAYNWGNAGRNILRGPREVNFDFTAEKKFLITESKNVLFRAEFFNIFNHPQFSVPASTVGSAGLATITSTSHTSRQLQLALKFVF